MAMYLGNKAVKIIERSKNLIPFPYEDSLQNGDTFNGVTYNINDDGTVILNGTSTEVKFFALKRKLPLVEGKEYTISGAYGTTDANRWRVYIECYTADRKHLGNFISMGGAVTFTSPTGIAYCDAYIYVGKATTFNNQVFKPMLNEGKPAPYGKKDSNIYFRIRSGVNMGRNPKNLIPFPYVFLGNPIEKVQTKNGVTFTLNDDGTVTANGTATAQVVYYIFHELDDDAPIPIKAGKYSFSDGGVNETWDTHMLTGNYIKENGSEEYFSFGTQTLKNGRLRGLYILIREGVKLNNVTFKPMLNEGTKALPYYYYD